MVGLYTLSRCCVYSFNSGGCKPLFLIFYCLTVLLCKRFRMYLLILALITTVVVVVSGRPRPLLRPVKVHDGP